MLIMIGFFILILFLLNISIISMLSYNNNKWYSLLSRTTSKILRFQSNPSTLSGYESSETKSVAYEVAKSSNINMPAVILVNPFLDANVGSVSRSMLNFGLTDLRIVDPCCNITSDNALALSAGASAILYNAKVYKNLSDAICDLQRVFATTVRLRYMNQLIYTPREAANEIVSLKKSEKIQSLGNNQSEDIRKNCGIVFGRERNGLNNNEVALADSIITIPTFKHFSSLNLAQAVNIVGYEMWTKKLEIESTSPPPIRFQVKRSDRLARKNEIENLFNRLTSKLDEREYQTDVIRRDLNYRSIHNMLQRAMLSTMEIDMLHGVLTSLAESHKKNRSATLLDSEHVILRDSFNK